MMISAPLDSGFDPITQSYDLLKSRYTNASTLLIK